MLAEQFKGLAYSPEGPATRRQLRSLLYADDVVMLAESPEELNAMIEVVRSFCGTWRIEINLAKSQVMEVHPRGVYRKAGSYYYGSNAVEVVHQYKYLGLMLTDTLSWDAQHDRTLAKARKGHVALAPVARHPRRGLSQQCAGPSTAPITTFPFQVAFDLEFHTFPPPNLAAVVDAMDEANVSSPHIGWKLSVNTSAATSAQDWMLVFQWGAEGGAALQSQPLSNTGWATGRVFAMLVEGPLPLAFCSCLSLPPSLPVHSLQRGHGRFVCLHADGKLFLCLPGMCSNLHPTPCQCSLVCVTKRSTKATAYKLPSIPVAAWAVWLVPLRAALANGSGTVQVVRDGSLLGAPVATLDWAGFSPLPLVYLQDTCCSERDLNATVCATDSSTTTTTTPIPTTINPCPIGMYGSAPSCVGCPAGRYGSEMAASAACDGPCAPGYYCPTGSTSPQAVPCPEGSWSPLGESSPYCVACQAGRYGSTEAMSDPTCTGICQPGYYCLDRSTMPNLTVCPLGSWSTFGEVSPYCQACPEGRYGNGISTDSNCSGPCDPGFTCPERSISPKGDTNTSTSRTTPVVVIVLAVILGAAVCAMLVLGADAEGRRR
eukprot:g78202.t1